MFNSKLYVFRIYIIYIFGFSFQLVVVELKKITLFFSFGYMENLLILKIERIIIITQ
jgi:hypothetical protein